MSENPNGASEHPSQAETPDDVLRALALRLLVHPFPGQPGLDQTALLVGTLPSDLPEPLPIPAGARVLGSLMRGRQQVEVIYDTDLQPEAALTFYHERLGAAGWRPAEPNGLGGFAHGGATRNVAFCRSRRGPTLVVDAVPAATATQVRLSLQVNDHYRCSSAMGQDPFRRLPQLTSPAGGEQQAMGGSGGSDSAHATARLISDLALPAVAAHYRAQLERAGWTQTATGAVEPAAWSTFTFVDEEGSPWRGTLFVLRWPGTPRECLLQLWVEAGDAGSTADGGWDAWASMVQSAQP